METNFVSHLFVKKTDRLFVFRFTSFFKDMTLSPSLCFRLRNRQNCLSSNIFFPLSLSLYFLFPSSLSSIKSISCICTNVCRLFCWSIEKVHRRMKQEKGGSCFQGNINTTTTGRVREGKREMENEKIIRQEVYAIIDDVPSRYLIYFRDERNSKG